MAGGFILLSERWGSVTTALKVKLTVEEDLYRSHFYLVE